MPKKGNSAVSTLRQVDLRSMMQLEATQEDTVVQIETELLDTIGLEIPSPLPAVNDMDDDNFLKTDSEDEGDA